MSIDQGDKIVVNIYAPNNKALKYMKQKFTELTGERGTSTVTVGFLIPCSQ